MARWWPFLVICVGLAGCGSPEPERAPAALAPAPAATPESTPAATAGSLEQVLAAVRSAVGATTPEARRAGLQQALATLDAWREQAPGEGSRRRVAEALELLGDGSAAPSEETRGRLEELLSTVRSRLADEAPYGVPAEAAQEALSEAEVALGVGRWSLAHELLVQAAAAATLPPLAAAAADLRRGLANDVEPAAAAAALAATWHLVAARGAVGQALARARALALGEARDALAAAQGELQQWAGDDPDRQRAVASLLSDLAGAAADLETASPGLTERLTALWKKLGREPIVSAGGA